MAPLLKKRIDLRVRYIAGIPITKNIVSRKSMNRSANPLLSGKAKNQQVNNRYLGVNDVSRFSEALRIIYTMKELDLSMVRT